MANPQELSAMFGNILTPQTMEADQQAQDQEALKYYAQQSPWQYELQRSLNGFNRALPNSQYRQEQAKAAANEQVLKRATQTYGQKLRDGSTPDDAQFDVIETAIKEFSDQGNWEAIQSLMPQYTALQEKRAQIAKLYQEGKTAKANESKAVAETADIATNNAQKDRELATGEMNARTALGTLGATQAKTAAEIRDKGAVPVRLTGDKNIIEAQRDLNGQLYIPMGGDQRKYLGIGDYSVVQKDSGPGKTQAKDYAQMRQQAGGVLGVGRLINRITDIYDQTPQASSRIAGLKNLVGSFKNEVTSSGADAYDARDKQVIDANKESLDRVVGNNAELRGVVIDLAYSLARAREPGGRISNQDFNSAIQTLAVMNQPRGVAMQVLDGQFTRAVSGFRDTIKMNDDLKDENAVKMVDEAQAAWTKRKGATSTPTAPALPQGWTVRKK